MDADGAYKETIQSTCWHPFYSPGDNPTQVEKDFSEKAYKDDGEHDVKLFRETEVKAGSKRVVTQEQLNEKAKSLGLSFYKGGLDEELELVEKIRLVLPKQNVIWKLYKRFLLIYILPYH